MPKNSELSKCRRIGETNSPISSLHAFRFISQKVSEVLKSANLTVISKEEFVTLRGNPDLIKAMTSGASFTPDDVESIYVLLPGAVQDGDIWRFPMYNVTKGIEVSVVSFKLGRAISAVNGKNWWSDSADAKGLVSAFKLTKFKPEKAGNNFVFANNMYQAVVIAEHFNTAITPLSEEDVEELIGKSYADMKPGEYAKKDRYLKWARRQAINYLYLIKRANVYSYF